MKKYDIVIAAVTGEIVALYFLNLLRDLAAQNALFSKILWLLPFVFPVLSVFGLWIAYLIGKRFVFVFQLAKFLLIGALATIFDLGTLSLFIKYFAVTAGLGYAFFKGVSFIIATSAKYFADKFWAFKKTGSSQLGAEFGKFFLVTLVGLVVNVATASLIVNQISPPFGFSLEFWANLGGMAAVLTTFAWNFIGYKFIVFKV